ncbi:MAG: hypothetical protein IT204_21725 [Fimbriimonadaceae bacterium]|nr:hypothetical protein [Fimbriimonadaceae bacterium]
MAQWACEAMRGVSLGDPRRNRRLLQLRSDLAAVLNEACVSLRPGNGPSGPDLAAAETAIRAWAGPAVAPAPMVVWQPQAGDAAAGVQGRCGGSWRSSSPATPNLPTTAAGWTSPASANSTAAPAPPRSRRGE